MKPAQHFLRLFTLWASALLLCCCTATKYSDKSSDIKSHILNQQFEMASAEIEQNTFLKKDRNRLLYLMEKGKMEHLSGNYELSNQLFEEAYIMIEDRIKDNVGQAIAAKLTNPMAEPYKGEDFEKVTVHYYKALNFFQLGDPAAALVEAKRINIKLTELNSRYTKNKNKYTEDAFSQILQGMLYEATGDINNAFIAYRNATDLYLENEGSYFGVPIPDQLKKDLLRTAKKIGFQNEYNRYSKKFDLGTKVLKETPEAEAIVFWENGLGPEKDQTLITASGAGGVFVGSYDDGTIAIPIPPGVNIGINALAIPKYTQRNTYYHKAGILIEDKEEDFDLAQNYYSIAKQCLRDRMMREVIDMATRFVVKKGVSKGLGFLAKTVTGSDLAGDLVELGAGAASAATEKADTRNWQSLPATISYTRIPLKENSENVFVIKKYGAMSVDYDTLRINYKKGLQLINYFDLGRTTTGYVIPEKIYTDSETTALAGTTESSTSIPDLGLLANSVITPETINENPNIAERNESMEGTYENMISMPVAAGMPDAATLYIIRKKKSQGSTKKLKILFNGKKLFKIKNGSFQKIWVSPGQMSIELDKSAFSPIMPLMVVNAMSSPDKIELVVAPGNTYYLNVESTVGGVEHHLLSPEEAQGYLAECADNGAKIKINN